MNKDIGTFVLSILIAPVFGILFSLYALQLVAMSDPEGGGMTAIVRWCAENHDARMYCHALREFTLLKSLSFVALVATILLPLTYTVILLSLSGNRAALARGYPLLVRICLAVLPFILVAHAILIAFIAWEAIEYRFWHPSAFLLFAIVAVVGALLLAAFNILTDMRQMLAVEPLRVTGIAVDESRAPDLHARARRIAQKLGAAAPRHIVVGIEPMVFMTSIPVRLRGVGDVPEGETLYVSTLALRTLDDTELDGLLAYEIAHFTGSDLAFSRRFAPAQAALANAVDSVDEDVSESVFMRIAKAPAYGLLSLMLLVLRWRMRQVHVDREAAADQAALGFAPALRMIPMIIKMTVLGSQWLEFRRGLTDLMNRGIGRRNIARDYLQRLRDHLGKADAGKLRFELSQMTTPHPLDPHLSLGMRAASIGIDDKNLIAPTVIALRQEQPEKPVLVAIEEEVTKADLDYTRVPGHPIKLEETVDLPKELTA